MQIPCRTFPLELARWLSALAKLLSPTTALPAGDPCSIGRLPLTPETHLMRVWMSLGARSAERANRISISADPP